MADQDIIRKIEALLAKANGTDNENEAQAFFSKASELMLKYSIDMARVREQTEARDRKASARPVKVDFMYATNDSNAVGRKQLLHLVSMAHGVRMVDYSNRRYENVMREGNEGIASQWCALIGFESDIEMVKLLYASLYVQAARFAHLDWKQTMGVRANKGKSKFFTGYLVGFAGRVKQRFDEIKAQVPKDSMALVVRRDAEVDEAVRECFPRLRSKGVRYDGMGAMMGRAAGDRADLGQPRATSGARALGSGR